MLYLITFKGWVGNRGLHLVTFKWGWWGGGVILVHKDLFMRRVSQGWLLLVHG